MMFTYWSYVVLLLGQAAGHNLSVIVIDIGPGLFKAGFAGDDAPTYMLSKFERFTEKEKRSVASKMKDLGHNLEIPYPIEDGIIINWEDMRLLWNFTFIEGMHINSEEHPILLTELPVSSRENRQKMAEIMFDDLNIPALYIANQAFLALYSANCTTGIVLYSEYDVTYSVPILEGRVITHAIMRLDVDGRDVTNCLIKMMNSSQKSNKEIAIANDIKARFCYVALDFQREMIGGTRTSSLIKRYKHPNGIIINLGNEIFRCPEALFKPSIIGKTTAGIHEVLHNSLVKSNTFEQDKLYGNIVLTGGSMVFPGIVERLTKEIKALAPANMYVNVTARWSPYSTWIGGSTLASQSSFSTLLIKREDYQMFGPSIIK